MKRLFLCFVAAIITLSLCACTSESPTMVKENCDVNFGSLTISLSGDLKQATDDFLEEYDYVYGKLSRSDQEGFEDESFFLTGAEDESAFIVLALFSAPEGMTIDDVKYSAQQQGYTIQDVTVDEYPAAILTQSVDDITTSELIFIFDDGLYSAWTLGEPNELIKFSKIIQYNI